MINTHGSLDRITFNDTEENIRLLYAIIGTLLPASYFNDATFCTQYSTQLDYTLTTTGMPPIKIRNIFASMIGSTFNYQDELAAGNIVFNFEKKICSKLVLGRYINDVMQSLESSTLFAILKKIESVNNIIAMTQCHIDIALAVYYLNQKNFRWFTGASEYSSALEIALKYHYINEKEIAFNLYNEVIISGKWGKGNEILSLIKFTYDFSDRYIKDSIMNRYFSELTLFGVNIYSGTPQSSLAEIKNKAPFPWNDYSLMVVNNSEWERYIEARNGTNELYYVFDALVNSIALNLSEAENNKAYMLMDKIIRKSITHRSLEEFKLYLNCAKQLGDKALNWLIMNALGDFVKCQISDVKSMEFAFSVICSLENEQEKTHLITTFISNNMRNANFMDLYIKYSDIYKSLFESVENLNKEKNDFRDFLFRKEAYVFKTATKVNFRSLDSYFNKYYRTGYDSGIYIQKIKLYLGNLKGKDKIAESIKFYDQLKDFENSFADMILILDYLNQEIFSLSMEELINYAPTYLRSINELNVRLRDAHFKIPDNYSILRTILLVRGKLGEDLLTNCIKQNTLYSWLNDFQLEQFISNYFIDILQLYCEYKEKGYKSNTLLRATFERPISYLNGSIAAILNPLEKLSNKEYYEILADIFAYAFNVNDRLASNLIFFVSKYVDTLSRGDYKKLFKKICELISEPDLPKVKNFIDKYLKEHMSFFEKIFNKNNKE